MAEDLAKLQVKLEAQADEYVKALKRADSETKRAVDSMSKETERLKKQSSSMDMWKNTGKLIAHSIRYAIPNIKAMNASIKNYVKEAQVAAGVKMYTDEYAKTQESIEKLQGKLNELYQEEKALQQLGKSEGDSEQYRDLRKSAEKAREELVKLESKMQELKDTGKAAVPAPNFSNMEAEYQALLPKVEELQKEFDKRLRDRSGMLYTHDNGTLGNIKEDLTDSKVRLEYLKYKIEEMKDAGKDWQPTKEAEKLSEQIERASEKLEKYKDQMVELRADGVDRGTDAWIKNQKEIAKARGEMEKYQTMSSNMESSGQDVKMGTGGK